MPTDFDLAIVGSGFGGSLLAMVARRIGLSVLLLERGAHPRFAIGESTSPLANLIIEQIATRYDLPRLVPLTSIGPWQRAYPELVCGLKRGFTFYKHESSKPFANLADRSNQLMVAASPNDELADMHWLRSDVDTFLMREAVTLGVEYLDNVALDMPEIEPGGFRLTWDRAGRSSSARARLLIDASGPRGYLSRAFNLPTSEFAGYPATQTLYTHFTGVHRCDDLPTFANAETPPYPPDHAALHHCFDGGWMWVLRFGNGVTSAGVAATDRLASELDLAEGAPAWDRLLRRFPSVGDQFRDAIPIRPFVYAPRMAWRATEIVGPNWTMLPSAVAFVDPLFSAGIPLTLLGIERIGRMLEETNGERLDESALGRYAQTTLAEANTVADLIGGCYAGMRRFPDFVALSMFYFAAASFSEMARRLDRTHLVTQFLAGDNEPFRNAMRLCARRASEPQTEFELQVAEATEPLNIAGLADPSKRNWYGVDLNDLVVNARKLKMTQEEMREVTRTAQWAASVKAE